MVDQFSGSCLDKAVKPISELFMGPGDGLVLGVNPVSQEAFAERLQREGRTIVRWDDYVRS